MPDERGAPALLIASVAGRALACAAHRAGLRVRVLDLFNDLDTRACAEACALVPMRGAGMDPDALLAAAERLAPAAGGHALIYGSGFEHAPDLLERLAHGRELLGTSPQATRAIKDPASFFGLLRRLGIPHPETCLQRPVENAGWLVKRIGGAGGTHVQPLGTAGPLPDVYYQRCVEGRPCSVLFLADGREPRVVGYSEQWLVPGMVRRPYLYGGAVGLAQAPAGVEPALGEALAELVAATGVRGLCSVDFMHQPGRFFVLEINARPSATFELHDGPDSLLHAHIRACRGELPRGVLRRPQVHRAHGLMYSDRHLRIVAGVRWPDWTADRPPAGTRVDAGQPVCTVCAEGSSPAAARRLVSVRMQWLRGGMQRWSEAA